MSHVILNVEYGSMMHLLLLKFCSITTQILIYQLTMHVIFLFTLRIRLCIWCQSNWASEWVPPCLFFNYLERFRNPPKVGESSVFALVVLLFLYFFVFNFYTLFSILLALFFWAFGVLMHFCLMFLYFWIVNWLCCAYSFLVWLDRNFQGRFRHEGHCCNMKIYPMKINNGVLTNDGLWLL